MITFLGKSSGKTYTVKKLLGEGGQGYVLLATADNGQKVALKWFKKAWNTQDHRYQIQSVIEDGRPDSAPPDIDFIWPSEIVERDPAPQESFGYVMPLINTAVFKDYFDLTENAAPLSLLNLCRICYNFATALRFLHQSGKCYGDINFGNLMFNPASGQTLICDNDNVMINNRTSRIGGVVEFMAPEVALGETFPNRDSDLYSLAVTLYHLFMWHHPLDGRKTHAVHCWDNIAKRRYFAVEPLFVFDPDDDSNSTDGDPELKFHQDRWFSLCPPTLKGLFTRSFTAGLKDFGARVQIIEWQRSFLEAEANAIHCSCGAQNIWTVSPTRCFKCRKLLQPRLHLVFNHSFTDPSALVAAPGSQIRQHHIDPSTLDPVKNPRFIIGEIEHHPKSPEHVILRNHTEIPWRFTTSSGHHHNIDPGTARPIAPGAIIRISDVMIRVHN